MRNPVKIYIDRADIEKIHNELSAKIKRGDIFTTNRADNLIQLLDTITLALYVITLDEGEQIKQISIF